MFDGEGKEIRSRYQIGLSTRRDLTAHAFLFADKAHRGQVRKYTGEPYIAHPAAVAKIVATVTDDVAMVAAALLHDTLEDTTTSYLDLVTAFGHDIADLVLEVTDVSKPSDGNRSVRKEIDRQHLAKASPRAKTIKLADLIHNSESICRYGKGFAVVYMLEKGDLLKVLKQGDSILYQQAEEIIINWKK